MRRPERRGRRQHRSGARVWQHRHTLALFAGALRRVRFCIVTKSRPRQVRRGRALMCCAFGGTGNSVEGRIMMKRLLLTTASLLALVAAPLAQAADLAP